MSKQYTATMIFFLQGPAQKNKLQLLAPASGLSALSTQLNRTLFGRNRGCSTLNFEEKPAALLFERLLPVGKRASNEPERIDLCLALTAPPQKRSRLCYLHESYRVMSRIHKFKDAREKAGYVASRSARKEEKCALCRKIFNCGAHSNRETESQAQNVRRPRLKGPIHEILAEPVPQYPCYISVTQKKQHSTTGFAKRRL